MFREIKDIGCVTVKQLMFCFLFVTCGCLGMVIYNHTGTYSTLIYNAIMGMVNFVALLNLVFFCTFYLSLTQVVGFQLFISLAFKNYACVSVCDGLEKSKRIGESAFNFLDFNFHMVSNFSSF